MLQMHVDTGWNPYFTYNIRIRRVGFKSIQVSSSLPTSFSLTQLDGYIARTWPTQKSALGSALDPLADKILISILYLSLTYAELIPGIGVCISCNSLSNLFQYNNVISCVVYFVVAPLTALVIFRDIGLIAAVFWVRYKTVPPPVRHDKFHFKQAYFWEDCRAFFK